MHKVIGVDLMREYENYAMGTIGVPEVVLLENAGAAVESAVLKRLEAIKKRDNGRVAVVCGKGNNGEDGLVAARRLRHKGIDVDIFYTAPKMKNDAYEMLEMAGRMGVPAYKCELMPDFTFDRYDIIVDAIFGMGLSYPPERVEKRTIEIINRSGKYVIAVDVPSGLCANSGKILGTAVRADETITFAALKTGHLLLDGRDICGKITVADIGVKLDKSKGATMYEDGDISLPPRRKNTHKGDYGKIKIVAGCHTMPGAALLAAKSCLRGGAGTVTLVVPESMREVFSKRVTEETLKLMPDHGGFVRFDQKEVQLLMQSTDVMLIGNGMGGNPELLDILREVLGHNSIPVVIDADGLNALAGNLDILLDTTCKVILTPHLAEFARLLATDDMEKLERNLLGEAQKFAKRYQLTLVVKGATTVITDGDNTVLNITGTPALAKAGSGDVLAGLIAALSASLKPLKAASYGAFFFGKAATLAAAEKGEHSLLASEIADYYKKVL